MQPGTVQQVAAVSLFSAKQAARQRQYQNGVKARPSRRGPAQLLLREEQNVCIPCFEF